MYVLLYCFRQLFLTSDGGTIALDWLTNSDGKILVTDFTTNMVGFGWIFESV